MMEQITTTHEINEITFGIYSAEEIKKFAVCEITSPKLSNNDKISAHGTVYDPRLGTIETGKDCVTCSRDLWSCPGHFGYISLNEAIVHPLFYKHVVSFLRCFCAKCYSLLITKDQMLFNNYNRFSGIKRFEKILDKLEKLDMCIHCSHPQPIIKYTTTDNNISMIYKDKEKGKISIVLQVDEIKKIFDNISNSDIKLLGFNPDLMHPRNLILTVFPVIPTCTRPYVITDGNISDDDLTTQLIEILKANNHLFSPDGIPLPDTKKQKALQTLKFRIATFYNNSCLAPNTPVRLFDGTTKLAKDVKWGDELIGDDGKIRNVLSTCEGEDEMFEIIQEYGDSYTVNSNHILTLKFDGDEVMDVSLKNYIDILEEYSLRDDFKGFKYNSQLLSTIKIKPLGRGRYNGFIVDGNHRFLLGDYTVTHNSGRAKHSTNGRAIKGIKERLTGKNGIIRTNLLGKRVDMSGRTVIGPDPTIKMGQMIIPPQIASNLTMRVHVTNFNIEYLTNLIDQGKVNLVYNDKGTPFKMCHALFFKGTRLHHGDTIIRIDPTTGNEIQHIITNGKEIIKHGDRLIRNGEEIFDLEFPEKRVYKLEIGNIVERQIMDGDILLLNRQPTLHSQSMLAQEVLIREGKTIRFNLAINKGFNADFDGDEMNLHVPASPESEAELRILVASQFKIISAQSSKPIACIVQDSLVGAYMMTKGIRSVTKAQFFNIAIKLDLTIDEITKKMQNIRRVFKLKNKKIQCFHGKGLISLTLPDDFYYEKKNNADTNEPVVKIYQGVLYEGTLDKATLGAVSNSLIHVIHKEYGPATTTKFIDGIQFVTNNWLLIAGFSVGLKDCVVQGNEQVKQIEEVIQKCYIEAEGIKNTTNHPGIREIRITGSLSNATNMGLRIAKEALDPSNNFLSTVQSGSKGDYFNIAQITGLLGQQTLMGQRIGRMLNNGKRSLPHYPFDNLSMEDEYESRGFIATSFISGLNPKQFYFHNVSGRSGVIDTSMNTATSGYIQRKIIKLTEDIKVQYTGIVSDAIGSIYQFAYNEDYLDPTELIKVENDLEICNISSLVNKLNMKYEMGLQQIDKKKK